MSNPRTDIERGVISLLAPLTSERGRYLKAVDHYNGEVVGDEAYDTIKSVLLGRSPGVLVQTGTSRPLAGPLDRRHIVETFNVEIYVLSTHWGSHNAQRLGDDEADVDPSVDPGTNQMLKDVRDLLDRQKPLEGGQMLEWQGDAPIFPGGRGFTLWRSIYAIVARQETPRKTGSIITEYEARNHLKPLTEPVPESPVNPIITTEGTVP